MFLLPFLLLFHFFFQTHSINSINLGFVSILLARRRLSGDGCGWQMATSQSNSCNYSIRRSMPPDQTWERMRIGSEGATFFSHSNICDSWNISDVLDSWDISGSPRSVDSSVFVCFRLFSAVFGYQLHRFNRSNSFDIDNQVNGRHQSSFHTARSDCQMNTSLHSVANADVIHSISFRLILVALLCRLQSKPAINQSSHFNMFHALITFSINQCQCRL